MVGLGHFCYKKERFHYYSPTKSMNFSPRPKKNLHDSYRKSILLLQDALSAFIFSLFASDHTENIEKGIFPKQLRFVSQICSIVGTNGMTTILLSTICVTGGNTVPT